MKIAILSMQRVKNYGSVLQAYSLKKIIESITEETVDFIDPIYENFYDANMPIVDAADYECGNAYRINGLIYVIRKIRNHIVDKRFVKKIEQFQYDYLELNKLNREKKYDLVVEGSDEVFKCTKRVYKDLHGLNHNGERLITYAASCGSAELSGLETDTLKHLREDMRNFDEISVRDYHTKEYIEKLYDGEIQMHMDPVLMGDLCDIEHRKVKEKNYILIYAYANRIRTSDEVDKIIRFAKKKKLKTIAVGAPQIWCDKYIAESPLRILDYFYHADYVITDTFHGSIFSVINKANFVSIIRKTNKNKMMALLEQLGLLDRILTDFNDLEKKFDTPIDYNGVKAILETQKKRTRDYLENQIKKEK